MQQKLKGARWIQSRRKRVSDLAILSCLAPLALFFMLVSILLTLPELRMQDIWFTQKRIGKGGKIFTIHKLRTIRKDMQHFTRIGRLLSIVGADETPQLLYTIWIGDMALIGPRPLIPEDFTQMRLVLGAKKYEEWYKAYTTCRPGWMGRFSQPSRRYISQSPAYMEARYIYDTYYAREASLLFDIRILIRSLGMWCTRPRQLASALKEYALNTPRRFSDLP